MVTKENIERALEQIEHALITAAGKEAVMLLNQKLELLNALAQMDSAAKAA